MKNPVESNTATYRREIRAIARSLLAFNSSRANEIKKQNGKKSKTSVTDMLAFVSCTASIAREYKTVIDPNP